MTNTTKPALSASPVAQEPVAVNKLVNAILNELFRASDNAVIAHNTVYELKPYIERAILSTLPSPPATPAGVGADEIARALANSLGMDLDEEERMAARGHSPSQNYLNEWNKYANAILALLSRAGDQSNSTQKDGSR